MHEILDTDGYESALPGAVLPAATELSVSVEFQPDTWQPTHTYSIVYVKTNRLGGATPSTVCYCSLVCVINFTTIVNNIWGW